ncbi:hypothetical protein EB796_021177 [Bugula neritina]|uniref:C2H2-type domain-containing protein n=1 Tax=Bugula neritina TaxID=10212 RepID=A0A7J7J2U7_BUGNE|nr:hypothetical protein EB796_021177 [Bugula neritina]
MSLKLTLKNVIQPFICESCGADFKSALHLKYHRFRKHNHYRPFVCRLCHKAFRRINDLQQHRRKHIGDGRFYKCTVCDEYFQSRQLLEIHKGSHVQFEGHHECGYCSASFLNLAEAKLHVLLVHDDPSVLQQERPPRSCSDDSGMDTSDDVFCVKEGEGLKIKLKRKLSADEQATDDLNPGSHASDSGKGNSDMDEEDGLRNQILKMPTLVVHHNDRTITTTQHKHVHESNLLTKPKLELEKTSWGASKIQPRLDSSDFLSKTNFTSSLSSRLTGSLGSKLTPPRATFGSPAHPASFGFSMLNGTQSFLAAETKPPLFPPPPSAMGQFGNLNNKLFPSKPMLNSSAPGISFGKNSLNSSFTSNGLVNGSVFTAPPLFPKNTNITKFGQSPGFSSASQNAGLFGSAPKFGSTSSLGFGASKFGVTNPLAGMGSKFGSNSLTAPPRPRNGELSHEPVFGSREKVRMMLATKEKKTSSAFEQYAGSTSEQTSSNPFADAMRKAKNPSPRRRTDSELFEETSSSYYTESGESDDNSDVSGDLSGFTDEEVEDSKSMNELTEVKDLPEKFVPSALPTLPEENSIPEALGETPLQPWTSPVKVHKSPIKHPSPTKSTASPIPNHITDNLLESSASHDKYK